MAILFFGKNGIIEVFLGCEKVIFLCPKTRESPINIGSNASMLWMPRECGCGTAKSEVDVRAFRCGCPVNAGAEQRFRVGLKRPLAVDAP